MAHSKRHPIDHFQNAMMDHNQLTTCCLCTHNYPRKDFQLEYSPEGSESHSHYEKFRSDFDQSQSYPLALHEYFNLLSVNNSLNSDKLKLLQYIDNNIIGKNCIINGPWGPRKLIYADYTASGRSLWFIENYIQQYVLPLYGNTHSENNACSSQTTKFREEARALIKKSVNTTDDDVVIFTGTGSTGAIHKLVNILHLSTEENRKKFIIFISAFEHHSNILPWKATGIEIIRIPYNKQGILDENILKEKLEFYHNEANKHIICTFNAASNVTGIRTDVDRISTLVHQYHGWIFWDYASGAPYIKIDMNASNTAYKDAVFISAHKFVGGPGTPGILIGKKHLFTNPIPCSCGGGTVNFVTRTDVDYINNIEIREEGGTPDIIGSIRAGLVFQLKDAVGYEFIEEREDELVKKFFARLSNIPSLIILGSQTVSRLAIFSFLIYVPFIKKYLHYNFICSLLNDLFGIQVRSGCACAGPYALDLLGINDQTAKTYMKFLAENFNNRIDEENNKLERIILIKPGFTRLNLAYFASEQEIDYILNAIEFIAYHAWKFLPLYTYDPVTGVWHHREVPLKNDYSLQRISYETGQMISKDSFCQAEVIANDTEKQVYDYQNDPELKIPDKYKSFIWFALPKDIVLMRSNQLENINEHYID